MTHTVHVPRLEHVPLPTGHIRMTDLSSQVVAGFVCGFYNEDDQLEH